MDGLVHLTNPLQLLMLMSFDHYNPSGSAAVVTPFPLPQKLRRSETKKLLIICLIGIKILLLHRRTQQPKPQSRALWVWVR